MVPGPPGIAARDHSRIVRWFVLASSWVWYFASGRSAGRGAPSGNRKLRAMARAAEDLVWVCTSHPAGLAEHAMALNGCARSGHHGLVTAIPMPLMMPAAPEARVDADVRIVNDVPEDVPDEQDDAEHELVVRLRAGDRAAIETVYVAHHVAIRGFARRLVGDSAAAEDIVHETFVALPR